MNTQLPVLALATLLAGELCNAQTNEPADDWKLRRPTSAASKYHQVNSGRRVKARIVAPQATNVALQFLGGTTFPLTKGDDGAWVGISRPQDEGFHYYQLVIDGAGVPDPGSSVRFPDSRARTES